MKTNSCKSRRGVSLSFSLVSLRTSQFYSFTISFHTSQSTAFPAAPRTLLILCVRMCVCAGSGRPLLSLSLSLLWPVSLRSLSIDCRVSHQSHLSHLSHLTHLSESRALMQATSLCVLFLFAPQMHLDERDAG